MNESLLLALCVLNGVIVWRWLTLELRRKHKYLLDMVKLAVSELWKDEPDIIKVRDFLEIAIDQ